MSENHLIENHQAPTLLSTDEALPTMLPPDIEQQIAQAVYEKQVRTTLESLDLSRISFAQRGSVEISLQMGGSEQVINIPIKSLPAWRIKEISHEYQQCATKLPRRWDVEEKDWVQDQADPKFADGAMHMWNLDRQLAYDKVLYGIDVPITKGLDVVWNADNPDRYSKEEAIALLNEKGIQEYQIRKIAAAIDALSEDTAQKEELDFTKKSMQP
jgi:hypothetical protein